MIVEGYPAILGFDGAGIIAAIGEDVQRIREGSGYADKEPLKVGDRVILGAADLGQRGANQLFCAVTASQVARLPDGIAFSDGVVLPLALATAANGMFSGKDSTTGSSESQSENEEAPYGMGLAFPQIGQQTNSQGKVLLIWGGASSVGACAVQMAKAAGYEVAATASAANFDSVKALGADYAFDYKQGDVVNQIVEALKGKTTAGAFDSTMAPETIIACANIVKKLEGRHVVGTVLAPGMPFPEGRPEGVEYTQAWGSFRTKGQWASAVWGKWITSALEDGSCKCLPEKLIVGKGLESVQPAIEKYLQGVSAKKIVVEFD